MRRYIELMPYKRGYIRVYPDGRIDFCKVTQEYMFETMRDVSNYHRERGPAVIMPYGKILYMFNECTHRTDGPAVIDPTSERRYYVMNQRMTQEEFFLKYGAM